MKIVIRSAGHSDIESMVDLLYQLYAIEEDFPFNRSLHETGLDMMLRSSDARVFVADVDSRNVAGMVTVQKRISSAYGGACGIVEDVVVDSGYRGRGIGRGLLRHVEEYGRRHGFILLQLAADRNNTPALDFYASQGWEKTELVYLKKGL